MPQVLNIPLLHRVLQKTTRHTRLIGFEYCLGCQYARAWIYRGREYTKVAHGSAENWF